MRDRTWRQILSFAAIGTAGTLAYLGVYALLRLVMPPEAANVIGRVAIAIPTTAMNARLTFRSRAGMVRLIAATAITLVGTSTISSGVIALGQLLAGPSDVVAEFVAVIVGDVLAACLRFLAFRFWLFRVPSLIPIPIEPTTERA